MRPEHKPQEKPLLRLGPFSGGVDYQTSLFYLDPSVGAQGSNNTLLVPGLQNLQPVLGRTATGTVLSVSSDNNGFTSLNKFYSSLTPSNDWLATWQQGGSAPYNTHLGWFSNGSSITDITPSGTIAFPSNNLTTVHNFLQYQTWGFYTNGSGITGAGNTVPVRILPDLSKAVQWGITPPSTAPTATGSSSGGGLTNPGSYIYRVTFTTANTADVPESSPGPISNQVNMTAADAYNRIGLTSIPVSSDTQVTYVNIYRLGGTLGIWLYVGSVTNGTTIFTDTIADTSLTGVSLILHQDVPQKFNAIAVHKDYVWGFGYNTGSAPITLSDLWYSNYMGPWGFNSVANVIPIERNAYGDIGVALASLSSILIVFKTKSTWALFGDTQADFLARKLFDIGCVSQGSVATGYGLVFWLSNQGVYMFDGYQPKWISRDIQPILETALTSSSVPAVSFIQGRSYYLSIPSLGDSVFQYNLDTGKWTVSNFGMKTVAYDLDSTFGGEVVSADFSTNTVVNTWFTGGNNDLGSEFTYNWVSPVSDCGKASATKVFRHCTIVLGGNATKAGEGTGILVTVSVDPLSTDPHTFTKTINPTGSGMQANRFTFSLPPGMKGSHVQITLQASSLIPTVESVEVSGWIERDYIRGSY